MKLRALALLFGFVGATASACGGTSSSDGADGGCSGTAPECYGAGAHACCDQDPVGTATCVSGAWTCATLAAPGCDESLPRCSAPGDAGQEGGPDASRDGGTDASMDARPDSAVDARSDTGADTGADAHHDSGGAEVPCGQSSCTPGHICVEYMVLGCGSLYGPDGGVCREGTTLCYPCGPDPLCCPTTFECTPYPKHCGSSLSCKECGQAACKDGDAGGVSSSDFTCAHSTSNSVDCTFTAP